MKRFSLMNFMLMLIIVALLSACGKSEPESSQAVEKAVAEEKKILRIVTDGAYAPMEYMEGEEVIGFGVDFAKAVALEAGYEADIEAVGWEPMFEEIERKTADMAISSITITDQRKQTFDFSVPYYLSTHKIMVSKGSGVESGTDLKGKKMAVLNGSTGQTTAKSIAGENSRDVLKFADHNLAIQELLKGRADAVIADNAVIEYYVKMHPEQDLKAVTDDSFENEFYGVLFPKGSGLKPEIDEAINILLDNGKYAEIYGKWFGIAPDIETLKAQQLK
ncbi:transporter substrate-binding domain-containing protein [Planococcus sp. 1R117A]|uniref:transporter substrate-binding domain-containing protein n=1 Tax=Planococcus sp. 1R117A TaxID=3447020 RepID=UPI003EDC8AF7